MVFNLILRFFLKFRNLNEVIMLLKIYFIDECMEFMDLLNCFMGVVSGVFWNGC